MIRLIFADSVGLTHKEQRIEGVCSYLESILPEHNHKIACNFAVDFRIFVLLRAKIYTLNSNKDF